MPRGINVSRDQSPVGSMPLGSIPLWSMLLWSMPLWRIVLGSNPLGINAPWDQWTMGSITLMINSLWDQSPTGLKPCWIKAPWDQWHEWSHCVYKSNRNRYSMGAPIGSNPLGSKHLGWKPRLPYQDSRIIVFSRPERTHNKCPCALITSTNLLDFTRRRDL